MSFFTELKRRNVIRVATAYVIAAWIIIQVVETIFPAFGFGDSTIRLVVIVLAIAFIPTLVFSWAFEFTPEGLKREVDAASEDSITRHSSKRLDRIIMMLLALALGYFAFDKFLLEPARVAAVLEDTARQVGSEAMTDPGSDKSIAVLPFLNMSDDAGNEYFSDGISEELLTLLAKVPELRVISRTSAFSYKGKEVDTPTIARQLNVAHILEGSVRKIGNQVRITAQLIDARTDTHLWSETYDRTLGDIFAVQNQIASSVVAALKVALLSNSTSVNRVDPEAFALYLQAMHLGNRGKADAYEQAISLLEQALDIAPDYAKAWRGLATNYINQVGLGLRNVDEGYALAREAAGHALELDPDDGLAHDTLGWIAMTYERNLAGAAWHFEKALSLEPTNVIVILDSGELMLKLGRLDETIMLWEYVSSRDPVNPTSYSNLCTAYLWAGRFDEAIASMRTALTLSPGRLRAYYRIGEALLQMGKPEAALKEIMNESGEGFRLIGQAMAYHALGRAAESDAALNQLIEDYEQAAAYNIAYVFAFRGEPDRAFSWLDKAVQYNDPGLLNIAVNSLFTNLYGDPRWLSFLKRIGTSPEQLKNIRFHVTLPQ